MANEKRLEPELVTCELCLRQVLKSEAPVSETAGYLTYFCGLDCYRKWTGEVETASEPVEPQASIQLGHAHSKAKDDRVKRIFKRRSKGDDAAISSFEADAGRLR